MSYVNRLPQVVAEKDNFGFFDDFLWYVTAHHWASVLTDSGTATVSDAGIGGILALACSDGTVGDNDEAYVTMSTEAFKFAAGKPMFCEARIQFTEANTDDANVFFGCADAIGANALVDNGAGMKTSFSGAAIYKVDGGTVWKCVSSNGATQTISTSTATAGGSAYQTLRIEVLDFDSTKCQIRFYLNGASLRDSNNLPIVHTVLYSSATDMEVGAGAKNGDTNMETLNIDYIAAYQVR